MGMSDILKVKVKRFSDIPEGEVSLAIDEAKIVIMNYCNISSVPAGLMFTHANMAADLLNASYPIQGLESVPLSEVSKATIGDVSLDLDASRKSHKINLDSLILNYQSQLDKFRRLRW